MPVDPDFHFVFPGNPETRTGGYAYDREILSSLRELGERVQVHALPDGFPMPAPEVAAKAEEVLSGIPDGAVIAVDGLAFGVLPAEAAALARRARVIALVHHPLADEAGLSEAARDRLFASEKEALSHAHRVVVTSGYTAERLRDFGVERDRVAVIEPGTERQDLAQGSGGPAVSLLVVATVTPRKGFLTLMEALRAVPSVNWRLDCVGDTRLTPDHAAEVLAAARPFGARVRFHGALPADALAPFYRTADMLVSPSYYEGYGMALAEATAHGLPVLATTGGAVPYTTAGQAAMLVPPADVGALADALETLISDPMARRALADKSRVARDTLPAWRDAARAFAGVISAVAAL